MKTYTFSLPGRKLLCAVLLGTITLLGSCKKDPEPSNPEVPAAGPGVDPLKTTPSVTTTLAGKILDHEGDPLAGVSVQVSGASTLTTAEGTFMLENVSVPGNRCVLHCKKAGYFKAVWAGVPRKDQLTLTRIVMTSSAPTHTINAAAGGKAALPNGSEVQLPANGLVDDDGNAYSGQVDMSVHYQDPSSAEFGAVVAGGDMLAQRTDESTAMLYSYGILRVKLTGNGGEDLQVAPGKTATLTIDIPQSQLTTSPATIPLWFFDEEAGVWKEEGEATKQGDKYIGTVKHFTDWNADADTEVAYIDGRVLDCEGNPIPNCPVMIGQRMTVTRKDGTFSERVPANTTIHVTITPFSNLFIGKTIAIVNPLKDGETKDLKDLRSDEDFCAAAAKGIIKTKSGDPVKFITFRSPAGSMELYQPGSSFTAKLPGNTSITMKIHTASGFVTTREFKTGNTKTEIDLGEIDLTSLPVTVHGIVSCGNAMLSGATAKFDWAGGSATVISDALGEVYANIPTGQQVTVTFSHVNGSRTTTFRTDAAAGGEQSLGVINICTSSSTVGENSFVLSGDGFNNTLKTLVYQKDVSGANYDVNMINPNMTVVGVTDKSDTLRISLNFSGNKVGVMTQTDNTMALIQRKVGGRYVNYFVSKDYPGSQINITVTRYDPVGGLVEGAFSGTFKGEGQSGKDVTVTVTNGKFSVTRGPDMQM